MREERGQIVGDLTIDEPYQLVGSVLGNVTAVHGAKLYVRGTVYGDVLVKKGGRVHVYGNVSGNLTVFEKGKAIHSGVLGGNAINLGGRLYIDSAARVLGKIRTEEGETTIEPPPL